jgi:hypothetical protein
MTISAFCVKLKEIIGNGVIPIAHYDYYLFECQIAKLKYEKVLATLKVLEAPYYLY